MRWMLTGLFLVTCATGLRAQESAWGPRVGVDLAAQSFGDIGANLTDWKFGYLAGLAGDHDFGNRFHLLTEFLYIKKGTRTRDAATRTTGYTTLNYLEADVLGKFDLTGNNEGLFMTLGPTFSYFMGGRVRNVMDGQETTDYKVNGSDLNRRFEVGGAVGIGFDLKSWVLEFRGQTGLTAIDQAGQVRNVVLGAHFTRYFRKGE